MISLKRYSQIIGLSIGLLVILNSCSPQESKAQNAEMNPDLSLTLTSFKKEYDLGEPVYTRLQLRNSGEKEVSVFPSLNPSEGPLILKISPQKEDSWQFVPLSIHDSEEAYVTLNSGDELSESFPVFFGGNGWTFPRSGRYDLQVIYSLQNGNRISSNVLTLSINEDNNEGGRILLSGNEESIEAGKFLIWQSGDHLEAGINLLQRLQREFPNSIISQHIKYAMALNLAKSFTDYKKGTTRAPAPRQAINLFQELNEELFPPYVRMQRELSMCTQALKLGNIEGAELGIQRADDLLKNNNDLINFLPQLDRLKRSLQEVKGN